jgi:hypothetical protein
VVKRSLAICGRLPRRQQARGFGQHATARAYGARGGWAAKFGGAAQIAEANVTERLLEVDFA